MRDERSLLLQSNLNRSSEFSHKIRNPRPFPPTARNHPLDKPMSQSYMSKLYMATTNAIFDRELKKGSAELLILSLLESRARHGYEISQLIEQRSAGALKFNVASLYPLLYRLEKRGWITGQWVEKAGQRRRRYYKLTAAGKAMLKAHRRTWAEFVTAMQRITGVSHA